MKYKMMIFLFIILAGTLLIADGQGLLPEIGRPELLEISGEYLFLVEGATVYQYRLENFSFVRSFGKAGEGPGELKVVPSIVNYLIPLKKTILVVSMDKAIEFSHQGEVVREFKIPQFTNYIYPMGKDFLTMRFNPGRERIPDMEVALADGEFKPRQVLYSQKLSGGRNLMNLTFDGVNIVVNSRGIFVDQSPEGFVIARFDPTGKSVGNIRIPMKPVAFSAAHEKAAIERIKSNPEIKRIGWENIRPAIKIVHDDYVPLIQDLTAENENLWVMGAERRSGKVLFMRLDLDGKLDRKLFLPAPLDTGFANQIFGRPARFYRFHGNRYYYLRENIDEECWQILSETY